MRAVLLPFFVMSLFTVPATASDPPASKHAFEFPEWRVRWSEDYIVRASVGTSLPEADGVWSVSVSGFHWGSGLSSSHRLSGAEFPVYEWVGPGGERHGRQSLLPVYWHWLFSTHRFDEPVTERSLFGVLVGGSAWANSTSQDHDEPLRVFGREWYLRAGGRWLPSWCCHGIQSGSTCVMLEAGVHVLGPDTESDEPTAAPYITLTWKPWGVNLH